MSDPSHLVELGLVLRQLNGQVSRYQVRRGFGLGDLRAFRAADLTGAEMAVERRLVAEVSPSFGVGHWAGYHRVETERAKGRWQPALGGQSQRVGFDPKWSN